ncbi:autocrine proliferation repressor protein A-like [Protopterus annectens]|uniref:autocrine proliferation repressor protein A-like n=1 Tax=Protopterus annectens TaxID=7888 RepID=UPI001CFA2872|nr:autocrine proliferation repressor protein A-like [Protopterus annectens]
MLAKGWSPWCRVLKGPMLLALAACALPALCNVQKALDEYVFSFDPHYSYTILDNLTYRNNNSTVFFLNMTSQKWLDETHVDQPIWWHYLSITVPDKVTPGLEDTAFMFINGGKNHQKPPAPSDDFVAFTTLLAVSTGTIAACISQIPNEPLKFTSDPFGKESRVEDEIIAYTWWHFLNNHTDDPKWLLRFPMTKASVRGLDTIAEFAFKISGGSWRIKRFTVAGASKRGWTTWTVAAVDKRVISLIPIVMDELNLVKNLHHHYKSYGGWTFAFKDYYHMNITRDLDSPQLQQLADEVDPFSFNKRYMNKSTYIISTGGDEFFVVDNSHYFFSELSGDKYLRIIPNAEHSCRGHWLSIFFSMRAFFLSTALKQNRPKIFWNRTETDKTAAIYFYTDTKPLTIQAYHAKTLDYKRRDFRLFVGKPKNPDQLLFHPVIWLPSKVQKKSFGIYKKEFEKPKDGWLAFFIQVTYRGPEKSVLEFTTEVHIIPDAFPFPDCTGEKCYGTLV